MAVMMKKYSIYLYILKKKVTFSSRSSQDMRATATQGATNLIMTTQA